MNNASVSSVSFQSVIDGANIAHELVQNNHSAYLIIGFQDMENYGSHAWDGNGECPQLWKPKGGIDYCVKLQVDAEDDFYRVVNVIKNEIGKAMRVTIKNNDSCVRYPIGMHIATEPPSED
jgi:hypothetical protein